MLYTPLLPEAGAGTLEPRHVVVPIRQMCPHAELVLGRATGPRRGARTRDRRHARRAARDRVRAARRRARRVTRTLPIPGLAEHGLGFKDLADAIALRNRVLQQLERASIHPDAARGARVRLRRRRLRGRRGARRAERPGPRGAPLLPRPPRRAAALGARRRRAEDPPRDPAPARRVRRAAPRATRRRDPRRHDARVVRRPRGGALRRHPRPRADARLDGRRPREPAPRRARPPARRARPRRRRRDARVEGRDDVWALGDCAAVPNAKTPGVVDPPTCQHALRQARRLAKNLTGIAEAVRLPHARPGRDARPLQGDRRDPGGSSSAASSAGSSRGRTTCTSSRSSRGSCASSSTGRSRSSSAATSSSSRCSATRASSASAGSDPSASGARFSACVSDCLPSRTPAKRSPSRATRSSTASIVNADGSRPSRDLVPAERRRDGRSRARPHRVDRRVRRPGRFWFASTSTPRRFALRPLGRHEPGVRTRERAGDDRRELPRVGERVRRAIGTSTWIPREPDVFGKPSSSSRSSVSP